MLGSQLPPTQLEELSVSHRRKWLVELDGYRLFLRYTRRKKTAFQVSSEVGLRVWELLHCSNREYTLLFNGLEKIDQTAVSIRDWMKVPYSWRCDDIIATVSSAGSGIGYHAGHEDAIIVQVSGSRLWRVWDSIETSSETRKRLLLNDLSDVVHFESPSTEPILECVLNPGDILYIPPFFPHDGVTLEESISMGLGWRGIAPFHIAEALRAHVDAPPIEEMLEFDSMAELIEDCEETPQAIRKLGRDIIARIRSCGFSIKSEPSFLNGLAAMRISDRTTISDY